MDGYLLIKFYDKQHRVWVTLFVFHGLEFLAEALKLCDGHRKLFQSKIRIEIFYDVEPPTMEGKNGDESEA